MTGIPRLLTTAAIEWLEELPRRPAPEVDPWILAAAATSLAGFVLLLLRALVQARRLEITTGIEAMLGKVGEASTELAPQGTVRVNAEEWTARAEREPIHQGEKIEVVGVEGVTLRVKRLAEVGELTLPPRERTNV